MIPDVPTLLGWAGDGQRRVEAAVEAMRPEAVHEPSGLPGWTRGHLITHLARNADALVNLLTWARTGTPTPMYATPGQRDADIEAGAPRPRDEQLADLRETGRRFVDAARTLPAGAWSARVKSAQGRDIPAAEVPWLRVREVWIHLIDLDLGHEADVLPDDVASTLARDVATWMSSRIDTAIELRPHGHEPVRIGPANDDYTSVSGPANRIACWLTGRCGPDRLNCEPSAPVLPRWL